MAPDRSSPSDRARHVVLVAGARPNFMKIAPLAKALAAHPCEFKTTLVHTGQHYDAEMSKVFFEQLRLPAPDIDLEVGPGSHGVQTGAVMARFEPVVVDLRPDVVVVVGDVNSTLGCALVATKLSIRVAHVEAGLRSYDRTMPEEVNRVLTDQISDLLFITERSAEANLAREGIPSERVHFVGNVMIDTLLGHRDAARSAFEPARWGLNGGRFAVLTLHRPSNVDNGGVFDGLMKAISTIGRDVPVLFPAHPRTRRAIAASAIARSAVARGELRILEPLGYLEFLGLMDRAAVVLTDSGGVQEETTVLGVPCLTLRENTERPVTTTEGTNRVVGVDPDAIIAGWRVAHGQKWSGRRPEGWDGHAADRIAEVLAHSI